MSDCLGAAAAEVPDVEGFCLHQVPIGSGTMGVVYKATKIDRLSKDSQEARAFAVKVMNENLPEERLLHECQMLRAAQAHPNVLSIHESTSRVIIMDLCDGGDLFERIAKHGPMTGSEAVEVGRGILAALQHLHALSIVHRDVKPENVALLTDGRPVVVDFDSAAFVQECTGGDGSRVPGSLGYMAPEVIMRLTHGTPADIFSLGCLLYFILSKRLPFRTSTMSQASIAKRTVECNLKFGPPFDSVDKRLRDAMRVMIRPMPRKRCSAAAALAHEAFSASMTPVSEQNASRSKKRITQKSQTEPLSEESEALAPLSIDLVIETMEDNKGCDEELKLANEKQFARRCHGRLQLALKASRASSQSTDATCSAPFSFEVSTGRMTGIEAFESEARMTGIEVSESEAGRIGVEVFESEAHRKDVTSESKQDSPVLIATPPHSERPGGKPANLRRWLAVSTQERA
eukprot:TRINITY_DN6985_c0_g1_i1.p1 TRINITY_DN6985_c0_g1~~TRINITY_DN6985_c0_g1_i1.p1  ORF type:complete len:487 (-),score=51.34 TRINITY_DN6985_c0_g1_i1:56-1435(-)